MEAKKLKGKIINKIIDQYQGLSITVLRVVTGALLLAHGIPKLNGIEGLAGYIANFMPEPLNWAAAIGTIIVEVVFGLALIVGIKTRIAGILSGLWFLGIAFTVHGKDMIDIFNLNSGDNQTAFEYPFLVAICALVAGVLSTKN